MHDSRRVATVLAGLLLTGTMVGCGTSGAEVAEETAEQPAEETAGQVAEQPAGRTAVRSSDEAAVRAALQHYLRAHATGDGAHHRRVFHPEARLFWMRDGELSIRASEDYIAGAPGQPAEDEASRSRRIARVDVTGDAAVARIELDYPAAQITDYMSLLRIDGEWRIVNKIFHVRPRPDGGGS